MEGFALISVLNYAVCNNVIQNELVLALFSFVMDLKRNSVLQKTWRLSVTVSHIVYAP